MKTGRPMGLRHPVAILQGGEDPTDAVHLFLFLFRDPIFIFALRFPYTQGVCGIPHTHEICVCGTLEFSKIAH